MAVRVSMISQEHIKPSSPTPETLKSYNLSLFDQFVQAPYSPIILYYRNPDNVLDYDLDYDKLYRRLETLKVSLSKTLTHFYPLAGTTKKDFFSIDCNDVGAYFAVAHVVDTRLQDFLNNPDLELIRQLFPCQTGFYGSTEEACVTNIQVNVFKCHGIAIGLCISHKIVDGCSLSTFLKAWSRSSRGLRDEVIPELSAGSMFPAYNKTWVRDSAMRMWQSLLNVGKCSTRRFVFDSLKLGLLTAEAWANGVNRPTPIEVVSALLWKCIMAAAEEKVGFRKPSMLCHMVNLRKESENFLSTDSVGNLMWVASSECGPQSETGINHLVERVRDGLSKTNNKFVRDLVVGNRRREVLEESLAKFRDCTGMEKDQIGFTSWCDMGFYEVDFGWGTPLWVSGTVCDSSLMVFMNYVFLIETRFGKGIEAWVNMDEQVMEILQHNQELLEFALVDPSPLHTR